MPQTAAEDALAPLTQGARDRRLSAAPPRHADPGGRDLVWCRVLGPLQVWGPGGEVRLGRPHRQAVLGLLALQPNVVVHRESIIDALWGEKPPASAVTMIHSYVSQLRKLLPGGRDGTDTELARVGSGYQLRIDDDELDLLVFSRKTARAVRARDDGDLAESFRLFEEALGLWRGDPLAGIDLLKDHPVVTALRALRAASVVDYAEVGRTRAEYEKAIPHLRELTAREPLNERAHACLMTVLATSGQQAAALDIFGQIRHRLDDQLGVRPGAELAAVQLQVLRGQLPALQPAGLSPSYQQASSRTVPSPCQLPSVVPDFTGRVAEIDQLVQILAPGANVGVPLAVVWGLPGVGKTALALRAAHQLRPAFPDGQLWVQLDGASTRPRHPADILGEMLRALGVPGAAIPDALAEKAAMYRSRLADRKILVVVDDAGSAEQVRPIIPGTAGAAVIVTSRLQLTGIHGARVVPLDLLGPEDAVGLLARIVGQERVSAEATDAVQLVSACGRLPLAVRIAGARLAARPAWPVSLMSEALADQRRRLDELQAGSLSVRASLSMSYQALDHDSQRALCLLGILGPTDVAEWVIATLLGVADASDVVNRLADSSLLTPAGVDPTGFPRYRLHDLLRDYAIERLADQPRSEPAAAMNRLADAWLQLACHADSGLPREPYFPPPGDCHASGTVPEALARRLTFDPIAWFTAERLNLLTAIDHCCATGDHRFAARLASRLASYQHIQSRPDDTERMWDAVLAAARNAGDRAPAAHAELRLAVALCDRGRHAEAAPAINRCITAFEDHADQHALASALHWRAVCEQNLGFFEDGRLTVMRALDLARTLEDRHAEFLALRILAISQANVPGYRDKASRSCAEALAIAQELGQPAWELEIMQSVTHVANLIGRHQTAIDMCNQALELRQKLGVTVDEAGWLGVIGDAHQGLGHYHEAVEAYSAALPLFRDNFQHRHQALCLLKIGYAYQAMGYYEQAIASLKESLPIFGELQLAHYEQQALQTIENCRRQRQPTTPAPRAISL